MENLLRLLVLSAARTDNVGDGARLHGRSWGHADRRTHLDLNSEAATAEDDTRQKPNLVKYGEFFKGALDVPSRRKRAQLRISARGARGPLRFVPRTLTLVRAQDVFLLMQALHWRAIGLDLDAGGEQIRSLAPREAKVIYGQVLSRVFANLMIVPQRGYRNFLKELQVYTANWASPHSYRGAIPADVTARDALESAFLSGLLGLPQIGNPGREQAKDILDGLGNRWRRPFWCWV